MNIWEKLVYGAKQNRLPIVIVCVLAVLVLLSGGNEKTPYTVTGLGLNVEVTRAGTELLTAGGRVFSGTEMVSFSDSDSLNENYYQLQGIRALCDKGGLDYFLMDRTAMENLLDQELFLDLRSFFTEAELKELGEALIFVRKIPEGTDEPEEAVPVAVRLSELPFQKEVSPVSGETFFAVADKSVRLESCRELWARMCD